MPDPSIPRDEPTMVTDDRLADDSTHKVVAQVQEQIIKLFPQATPLIVLRGKTRMRRSTGYYKFEYQEVDKQPRKVTIATAASSSATTLIVETNDHLKMAKNYVFMNSRTREQVVLTGDPASETLTSLVARGIGGGAAAMEAGDELLFLAPIHQEADTLGTIKSIKEDKLFNYTEIIRTPMGWSDRTANTQYYGGKDPKHVRARTAIEHRISIELRGFFGKRHTRTTSDNKLQTFTGGAEYWITSHVWDLNGQAINERGLVEWMEEVMALGDSGYINGNGVKWLFCGNSLITEIEFFAREKLRYQPLSNKIGMRAAQFHTTHGTLNIMRHPQFTGALAGLGFVCDMRHIRYVYHMGRDTKLLQNRHARSFDGEQHEFLTDCGWQWEIQNAHGMIKNHKLNAA